MCHHLSFPVASIGGLQSSLGRLSLPRDSDPSQPTINQNEHDVSIMSKWRGKRSGRGRQRGFPTPLTWALDSSLELVEWNKANSGCCHTIGIWKGAKRSPQNWSFWDFCPCCQFLCMPSTASEGPNATDVGFGNFFGVGGVEESQIGMWSCHWKDAKRRPQNWSFWDFSSPLPVFVHRQNNSRVCAAPVVLCLKN